MAPVQVSSLPESKCELGRANPVGREIDQQRVEADRMQCDACFKAVQEHV